MAISTAFAAVPCSALCAHADGPMRCVLRGFLCAADGRLCVVSVQLHV